MQHWSGLWNAPLILGLILDRFIDSYLLVLFLRPVMIHNYPFCVIIWSIWKFRERGSCRHEWVHKSQYWLNTRWTVYIQKMKTCVHTCIYFLSLICSCSLWRSLFLLLLMIWLLDAFCFALSMLTAAGTWVTVGSTPPPSSFNSRLRPVTMETGLEGVWSAYAQLQLCISVEGKLILRNCLTHKKLIHEYTSSVNMFSVIKHNDF